MLAKIVASANVKVVGCRHEVERGATTLKCVARANGRDQKCLEAALRSSYRPGYKSCTKRELGFTKGQGKFYGDTTKRPARGRR